MALPYAYDPQTRCVLVSSCLTDALTHNSPATSGHQRERSQILLNHFYYVKQNCLEPHSDETLLNPPRVCIYLMEGRSRHTQNLLQSIAVIHQNGLKHLIALWEPLEG